MTALVSVLVPLRTGTGMNTREHHQARARRVAFERERVAQWLDREVGEAPTRASLPLVVTLTRVSPTKGRLPDDDNVCAGLKACRDQVGAWLGTGDAVDAPVTWRYTQERGPWAVRIDISEVP